MPATSWSRGSTTPSRSRWPNRPWTPVAASVVEPVDRAVAVGRRRTPAQNTEPQSTEPRSPSPSRTERDSGTRLQAPATKPVTEPVDTVAAADPVASAPATCTMPVMPWSGERATRRRPDRRRGAAPGRGRGSPAALPAVRARRCPGRRRICRRSVTSAPDTAVVRASTPGDTGAGASAERAAGGHARSTGTAGLVPVVPDRSGTPHARHAQLTAPPALPPTRDRAPFAPCGDFARTAAADARGRAAATCTRPPSPGGPVRRARPGSRAPRDRGADHRQIRRDPRIPRLGQAVPPPRPAARGRNRSARVRTANPPDSRTSRRI
ncbi:hypothetical protein SBADM41S_08493 [Streptomyces badius]